MQTREELEALGTAELRKLVRFNGGYGLTGLQIVNLKKSEYIELLLSNGEIKPIPENESADESTETIQEEIQEEVNAIPAPANNDLAKLIAESIAPFVNAKGNVDKKEVQNIVNLQLDEIRNKIEALEKIKQIEIVIKQQDKNDYKISGAVHEAFFKVLALLQCRTLLDMPLPILLVGGAGSSKTSTVSKVAEALNLKFYMQSCTDSITPSMFFGYNDSNGKYVTTVFRQAYEFGGCYLLDEFDAGNSNAILAINSALANGECSFPDVGMVKRHKDFICIASANTFGRGESGEYCGRNQLDSATLDRFVVVPFNYDKKFEMEIATGIKQGRDENEIPKYEPCKVSEKQMTDYVKEIQAYRDRIEVLHIKFIISPRASIFGVALMKMGFSLQEIETMVVFKGLSKDLVSKIKG